MLSPDFYTVQTTSGEGSQYNVFSETHGQRRRQLITFETMLTFPDSSPERCPRPSSLQIPIRHNPPYRPHKYDLHLHLSSNVQSGQILSGYPLQIRQRTGPQPLLILILPLPSRLRPAPSATFVHASVDKRDVLNHAPRLNIRDSVPRRHSRLPSRRSKHPNSSRG